MNNIPERFYRVSAKALILNEARDKFLLCEEESGAWELPGGGLDWGMSPQDEIVREVIEEMGLTVTWVAEQPSYFVSGQNQDKTIWVVNVVYETEVEHLNLTPSDECINIKCVDKADLGELNVFPTIHKLGEMFDPCNH